MNRKTGEKTLTRKEFEERYLGRLITHANKVQGNTVEDKIAQLANPSDALNEKLREFDRLYNVEWPMVHLKTAAHYLNSKGENKATTGG